MDCFSRSKKENKTSCIRLLLSSIYWFCFPQSEYQPIKESFFSLFFMEQKNKTVTFEIVRAIKQESCLMLLQNHCILDQSIEHIHVEYQL